MPNKKLFIFALISILAVGIFVSAAYGLNDKKYELQKFYSKGENIRGWINISFVDEPANSVFSDGAGNSVRMIDLLKTDARHKYSCTPANCESIYTKSAPSNQKQLSLGAGQEKLIGFVFSQDIDSINDFGLTITSSAQKSKDNQLKIDLFNDGINDIGNNKSYGDWSIPRDYSCFGYQSPQVQEVLIKGGDSFCQRVTLPEAPGFSLGAFLKKQSSPDSLGIKMSLYDPESENSAGECTLPDTATTQEAPVYCDINYLVTKQKNYYVCLSAEGTGTYKMKAHAGNCAFKGTPGQENNEIAAYRIFSQPRFFDAIGTLELSDNLPSGESVSGLMNEYIDGKYGNLSCSGRECIVPVKLISNVQQALEISGKVEYEIPGFGTTEKDILYELSESPAEVTAGAQKIYLDRGNFSVPDETGEYEFKLNFDNSELFTETVGVRKGIEIISLNPPKTAAGIRTNFKLKINANNISVSGYKWDFNGDGTTDRATTANTAEYSYNATGIYDLIVGVLDAGNSTTSESFSIEVGSAGEVLDELITEKQEILSDIKGTISAYDLFSSGAIENSLDLKNAEAQVKNISNRYSLIKDSGTEQQFQGLLSEIFEIEIPKAVYKDSEISSLTFFPDAGEVNLGAVSLIAGGDYDADLEGEYKDAVLSWGLNNAAIKLSSKRYSAEYAFGKQMLAKTFKAEIKNLGSENFYVFIGEMENLGFKESLEQNSETGYYYKELTGDETIEFYTTEDLAITSVPLFVAPSLDRISVDSGTGGIIPGKAGKPFKIGLFALIVLVVILLGIFIYLKLAKWYREKYESHLFKNKNDLYNIVKFIQSAKQQGKSSGEITGELKKSGWNGEQVSYVMRKYAGKKTGMPGFAGK